MRRMLLLPLALVATLVYHRRTELLQRASARGHSTLDGATMLVHQAAGSQSISKRHIRPLAPNGAYPFTMNTAGPLRA